MEDGGTLRERVRYGTLDDVRGEFRMLESHFRSVGRWIENNPDRTDKAVMLGNMLRASADYLRIAADNIDGHVSGLALATRSLYEINVRTRHMIDFDEGVRKWASEAVTDQIQVIEGIFKLNAMTSEEIGRSALGDTMERLNVLRKKHDLPVLTKPEPTVEIANAVGLRGEHEALFKLFSKLIHPSSLLVNDPGFCQSNEVRMTLQIYAQVYAMDTLGRICTEAAVPEEMRVPKG